MLWWIVATVCAFFIKGLCGFANTLVFTTILSFGHNNISISPVELLLGYPTNVIMAWKERKSIQWRMCIPLAVLVILGMIPGALFLKNVDTKTVKSIFGVVIIVVALEMLLRQHAGQTRQSKMLLGVLGILSGFLCGLYGIGALLGAYVSRVTDDSSSFKANICVVFFVENTVRMVLYGMWGILTLESLKQVVVLIPFMLVGLFLGIWSGQRVNDRIAKKLVLILLIVSGVAILFT